MDNLIREERKLKLYRNLPMSAIQAAAAAYTGIFVDHVKTEGSYHYIIVQYSDMSDYEAFLIRLGIEIAAYLH